MRKLNHFLRTLIAQSLQLERLVRFLVVSATVLGAHGSLRAAEPPVIGSFDSANKLYEQGKFSEAAATYEQLLKTGQISTAVYYNLGNSFFKAGQMGKAIAAYRQAERLSPRDPDLRANLQFARNQVQGPTSTLPAWKRWLGRLTLNEWTGIAGALLWLWLFLLGLMQFRPSLKPALLWYAVVSGAAFACACALVMLSWGENQPGRTAIVTGREAVARQGPLEESKTAFTLHDGAELEVLDRKDDWVQVSTDPRRIGWVHRDQIVLAPEI